MMMLVVVQVPLRLLVSRASCTWC